MNVHYELCNVDFNPFLLEYKEDILKEFKRKTLINRSKLTTYKENLREKYPTIYNYLDR